MTAPTPAPRTRQQTRLRERYGPTAVVTGASSGIGRSCATFLAEAGFDLVVVARSGDALRQLAIEVERDFDTDVRIVVADLSTAAGIDTVVSATAGLDVGLFVPAAGFGTSGSLIDNDSATEIDMVAVNCGAVLALTHVFADAMVARQRGGIVLFSSVVATQGVPLSANYAATKAYVHTLGEGLRHELRPRGVDVLVSAPGPVDSSFGDRAAMQMGGGMQPDDVARSTLHALGRRSIVRPGGACRNCSAGPSPCAHDGCAPSSSAASFVASPVTSGHPRGQRAHDRHDRGQRGRDRPEDRRRPEVLVGCHSSVT